MGYVKNMKVSIEKIENFDKELNAKVETLVNEINKLDFKGMIKDDDERVVRSHKNKVLRVINREVDKFARGIHQYVLPLLNITNDENEGKEDNQ